VPDKPKRPAPEGGRPARKRAKGTPKSAGRSTGGNSRSGKSGTGHGSGGADQRGGKGARTGGGSQRGGSGDGSPGRSAVPAEHRPVPTKRRRDLTGAATNLPNWVIEDLARVTPANRVAGALEALGEASEALADGAYRRAVRHASTAKELAPRDATVRETLGVAAYRAGDWQTALTELRAYRRLSGETTHLPVEMDALRALDRPADVRTAWETLQQRGGKPAVLKEGRVVYASFLIDRGDLDGAWALVDPGRMQGRPFEEDLRVWYVAARVAALRGDVARAGAIRSAILTSDPAFPGIDELEALIAKG
jgi:hypothetical protein